MKKQCKAAIIVTIVIFSLLVLILIQKQYNTDTSDNIILEEDTERLVENLILDDISNFENTQEANITFTNITISENSADAHILIVWPPKACIGYHYILQFSNESWTIENRERTVIC